jgi:hypothetical protein
MTAAIMNDVSPAAAMAVAAMMEEIEAIELKE